MNYETGLLVSAFVFKYIWPDRSQRFPTLGGSFTFPDTSITVNRLGYVAMQLAGPGVFGPPRDPDGAVAVVREAIAGGVNHIDTSDFYGRSPNMLLIPGTSSVQHLHENLHAASLTLQGDTLTKLDAIVAKSDRNGN